VADVVAQEGSDVGGLMLQRLPLDIGDRARTAR
jgi:hypothetical protein